MEQCSIKIKDTKLSIDEVYDFILDPRGGGNCLFVGTTRELNKGKQVEKLDFESYESMATREMMKIADACLKQFSVIKLSMHHRVGEVAVKEKAVIIGVSSIHRDDAFSACRFLIDQLKLSVPIWKKEICEDGSYWVNATP